MYYHIHLFNMFTHKEINAYFATTQVPVADPGISKRKGGGGAVLDPPLSTKKIVS